MNTLISIIIPCYNTEKYIKKCLDSVINQSYQALEIICVDDGSTDDTVNIIKPYMGIDKRIKLISQENRGLGYSRNIAINAAKGSYMFFLDSDDWIEQDTIESLYDEATKQNADLVVGGWKRIDEKSGKKLNHRIDYLPFEKPEKELILKKVFSANFNLMSCASLFRKDLFTNNFLYFPNTLHEDIYIMPVIYYHANSISFVKKNMYNWLTREQSITNTTSIVHAKSIISACYFWKHFLIKENIYKKYKKEYVRAVFSYLNTLINNVNRFAPEKEKTKIIAEISECLLSLPELAIYSKEFSDNELHARKNILMLYQRIQNDNNKQITGSEPVSDNALNNDLQLTLSAIQSSRGYKLLKKYYKFRDSLFPINSKRRQFIVELVNNRLTKKHSIHTKQLRSEKMLYDVVFMTQKDYHVWTCALIARKLQKLNISSTMIDLTDYYRDEGSRAEAKKFQDIPFLDYKHLEKGEIEFKAVVCLNDWDQKITNPFVKKWKAKGVKTIGVVEGIQDFLDKDTGRIRNPYQTVEYVLLTGKHDERFFEDRLEKTRIIGVPRLHKLMLEKASFPSKPKALINVNFSYGVLTDKREMWLSSAIEACKMAKIDYVITQHPFDEADLSAYNLSTTNMYDLIRESSIVISRFSSAIIEALAMGKPAVYHNPHGELAEKFQDPKGAYSLSFDKVSLAEAIDFELSLNIDYRIRANQFLDYHCNINSKTKSSDLAAIALKEILHNKKQSNV